VRLIFERGLDRTRFTIHTYRVPMITPLPSRILVKMLPVYDGEFNKLNLTIVDKRKHYDHAVRKAEVRYVGRGVRDVRAGDVVLIFGASGDSFGLDDLGANDGTAWRRVREEDCLAVEEVA
jgi:hypothetical protein